MARIPTLTDSPRLSTRNVPRKETLSPGEASATTRQLGGIVSQATNALMKFRRQQVIERRKAERTNAFYNFNSSNKESIRDLDENFTKESPSGNGYSQRVLEIYDKNTKETLGTIQDETVRTALEQDLKINRLNVESQAYRKEMAMGETYTKLTLQESANTLSSKYKAEYNPSEMALELGRAAHDIDSSRYLDENQKNLKIDELNKVKESMISGVIERSDIAEMQQVKEDLEDEDMQSVLGLRPDFKQKAMIRLERQIERHNSKARNEISSDLRNAKLALQMGTIEPDSREIQSLERDILTNMSGKEADSALSELRTYKKVNEIGTDLALEIHKIDPEKMASEVSSGSGLSGAASKAKSFKALASMKQRKIEQLRKDPASYIIQYDRSIAEKAVELIADGSDPSDMSSYLNDMDETYKSLGVPRVNRKYLPKQFVDHYGKTVNNLIDNGDYGTALSVLDELKQKSGSNLGRVWDELDLDYEVGALLEVNNPEDRKRLLGNMASYKAIKSNFKENFSTESDDSIKRELSKSEFYKAMTRINGGKGSFVLENAEGIKEIALKEYKRLRLNGLNKSLATERAFKAFTDSYDVVPNGDYPIPVNVNKNITSNVKHFLDNYAGTSADYVEDFGITLKGRGGVQLSKDTINDNIKSRGKWVYDKKLDGLRLIYRNDDGSLAQIVDKEGKDFVLPMDEVSNRAIDLITTKEEQDQEKEKAMIARRIMRSSSPWRR